MPIGELIKLIIDFVYFVYFLSQFIQIEEALWRPTECFLDRMKHSLGRQSTRCCGMEYSHSRQSTCYDCGNTTTADRVPDAAGWITLTGDRVLATTAEIPSRPVEYFRNLRKHRLGRQSTWCHGMGYSHSRQITCHDGESTLKADRVLTQISLYFDLVQSVVMRLKCDNWLFFGVDFGYVRYLCYFWPVNVNTLNLFI